MKYRKSKLSRQLLIIIFVVFIITVFSYGIVLPKTLHPVYENKLYDSLKQQVEIINKESKSNSKEIGYIYINNNQIEISNNLNEIITIKNEKELINNFKEDHGKFKYNNKTYYYYSNLKNNEKIIAISNNNFINKMKNDMIKNIFPVVIVTLLLVAFLLIFWGRNVVKKIEKLKNKIDHIEDDNYNHTITSSSNDELKTLELALEDMRISLKNQEEYRNQMYQNISHDFKTPLTVIKSYIEAVDDKVEDINDAMPIIKQQVDNLEYKVHSLLYLNKLDYIKDMNLLNSEKVEINKIVENSANKFKHRNENLEFKLSLVPNTIFIGTIDSWETIIDNILNNAIRYANKEIKITVKKNQLIIFNDGPNIDPDLVEDIFNPFRKGIKGEFGLGLSIVEKTLRMMGYDIEIKNHNKMGVSFIITKKN